MAVVLCLHLERWSCVLRNSEEDIKSAATLRRRSIKKPYVKDYY